MYESIIYFRNVSNSGLSAERYFCHEQVKALKQIGVDVDVVVPMTIYDKEYKKERGIMKVLKSNIFVFQISWCEKI